MPRTEVITHQQCVCTHTKKGAEAAAPCALGCSRCSSRSEAQPCVFAFHVDAVFCNTRVYIQQQLGVLWKGSPQLCSHFGETEAQEREMTCSQPRGLEALLLVDLLPSASCCLFKEGSFFYLHSPKTSISTAGCFCLDVLR